MKIIRKTSTACGRTDLIGKLLLTSAVCGVLLAVGPAGAETVAPANGTPSSELLGFGSRVGMEVTVVSKTGIGTAHASIEGHLTRANAIRYCEGYVQDNSERCVSDYLRDTKLVDSISADCETGIFSTFGGERFRFLGKSPFPDDPPEYIVVKLETGEALNGSSASGLTEDLEQFRALCPRQLASAGPAAPPSSVSQPVMRGRPVSARGAGVVPGALVCPDHETLSWVFRLYAAHWEESMQDRLTNGASRLMRGRPIAQPNLSEFGCVLLPTGTPMRLNQQTPVPVVSARLEDGSMISGVTLPAMIANR